MPEHSNPRIPPNVADHPQPRQRRPDSQLDAANPYAAHEPTPLTTQRPPGNVYVQGHSANVQPGQVPANPYATQQLPAVGAPQQDFQNYGQPNVGPASLLATQAQPHQRTNTLRRKLWAVLIAVLVIGGGLTAAAFVVKPSFLGFKKVLDQAAVERTIEQQSGGLLTSVSCPASVTVKAGSTFQCSAANGRKVDVVIKDSKGSYGWASTNRPPSSTE